MLTARPNTFVIFQFGSSSSENVLFQLPEVLLREPQDAFQASVMQRNMLVSVNYIYQQEPPVPENSESARTGSIVLNVPNIPSNRTELETSAIIEFAASIALSAIAACSFKRSLGVPAEFLDSMPCGVDSSEGCPICYDPYHVESSPPRKKRRVAKSGKGASVQTHSHHDHESVMLPCGHLFGRSCISEWLSVHTTCPLCRDVVHPGQGYERPPSRINLPNISTLLGPTARDGPVVVVLDRETNDLVALPQGGGAPDQTVTSSSQSSPRRSAVTSTLLSNLNEPETSSLTRHMRRQSVGLGSSRMLLGLNQRGDVVHITSNFNSMSSGGTTRRFGSTETALGRLAAAHELARSRTQDDTENQTVTALAQAPLTNTSASGETTTGPINLETDLTPVTTQGRPLRQTRSCTRAAARAARAARARITEDDGAGDNENENNE